jgi:hypothetical protein
MPRFNFGCGGVFRLPGTPARGNVPGNKRAHQAEPLQPIAEPLEVLLDPVLHDLRTVADVAHVGVDPLHHVVRPMAELAGHGVGRNGGATVQRLEPGGAVRVAESLRPELASGEACALSHAIEEPVDVAEPSLLTPHGPGGNEKGTPALEARTEHPGPQDRLELGPDRDHPVRGASLEGPPPVRPDGNRSAVEGDVIKLEAGHLPEPAPGQEEQGHQHVRMGRVVNRLGGRLLAADDAANHHV